MIGMHFPDISNADKVQEYIKNVCVDMKHAGGKTSDKPPRGMQDLKICEDVTRRASSDEERRYRKQTFVLTRKTGPDRDLKTSRFLSHSQSDCLSDHVKNHVFDDLFANEESSYRASGQSPSVGDPFRSATQSPTFQRGIEFRSPSSETSVNSLPFKLMNSENAVHVASEPEKVGGAKHNKLATFLCLRQSSVSKNSDSFDIFNTPFASQTVTSSIPPDFFRLPNTSSNIALDLLEPSPISSVSALNSHQLS